MAMSDVVLVASQNGLGHARRIFHYAKGFSDLGYATSVLISDKQEKLLFNELTGIQHKNQVVTSHSIGLDGPSTLSPSRSEPSADIIELLSKSKLVISDNLIWPNKYAKLFYLMGHFNWIDYWANSADSEKMLLAKKESDELAAIKRWLAPRHFSYTSIDLLKNIKSTIPLPRYTTDNVATDCVDEVWLASGTTGLNSEFLSFLGTATKENLEIKKRESHKLSSSNAPLAIIGRPGLGTMRDAIAHGVPFLPSWSGMDSELDHNCLILMNLGLLPVGFDKKNPLAINTLEWLRSGTARRLIMDFWDSNSDSIVSIVSEIIGMSRIEEK
jgi:hypothetical protein